MAGAVRRLVAQLVTIKGALPTFARMRHEIPRRPTLNSLRYLMIGLPLNQRVEGSSPSAPTKEINDLTAFERDGKANVRLVVSDFGGATCRN